MDDETVGRPGRALPVGGDLSTKSFQVGVIYPQLDGTGDQAPQSGEGIDGPGEGNDLE